MLGLHTIKANINTALLLLSPLLPSLPTPIHCSTTLNCRRHPTIVSDFRAPIRPESPCGRSPLPRSRQRCSTKADESPSGIFGYINYLVEKDRKYILNTLINGKSPRSFLHPASPSPLPPHRLRGSS